MPPKKHTYAPSPLRALKEGPVEHIVALLEGRADLEQLSLLDIRFNLDTYTALLDCVRLVKGETGKSEGVLLVSALKALNFEIPVDQRLHVDFVKKLRWKMDRALNHYKRSRKAHDFYEKTFLNALQYTPRAAPVQLTREERLEEDLAAEKENSAMLQAKLVAKQSRVDTLERPC